MSARGPARLVLLELRERGLHKRRRTNHTETRANLADHGDPVADDWSLSSRARSRATDGRTKPPWRSRRREPFRRERVGFDHRTPQRRGAPTPYGPGPAKLVGSLLTFNRSMFWASVGLSTTALGSERALTRTRVIALRMLSGSDATDRRARPSAQAPTLSRRGSAPHPVLALLGVLPQGELEGLPLHLASGADSPCLIG
jgi:hypothetical protein